jgi:uncharacterized membrane protein
MEKTDSSPLSRQRALYADKKQWNQFLSIFLLAVGVGFTVAGIILSSLSYNWEELPKFAKVRNSRSVISSFCPARYIHALE